MEVGAPSEEARRAPAARWFAVGWWRGEQLRHWPLLPILALALVLRLANLPAESLYGDEAEYATVARYVSQDARYLSYPDIEGFGPTPFVSQPPALLYLFAGAGALLGSIETGALVTSALLGAATVGLVYAIGVRLHGRATGAFAALFLAVLPGHVSLSRSAMLDVGLTCFMALAVLCFLQWHRHRTDRWALATGIAAAAATLAKLPGFLVFAPLAAGVAWMVWRARRGEAETDLVDAARLRRHIALAALPSMVLLVLYLGLLWYLGGVDNLFAKLGWQAGRVAPGGSEELPGIPGKAWHWYFSDPFLGIVPQLGPALLLLALGGAWVLALWARARPDLAPAYVAVLAWPLAVLGFFTASARKEWFYALPALPGLALLAGLPLGLGLPRLHAALARGALTDGVVPPARQAAAVAVAAALVLALVPAAAPAGASAAMLDDPGKGFGGGVREAALFIHQRDPDAAQVGSLLGRFTLHFYNGHDTYHWYVDHAFVEAQVASGHVRFIVEDRHLDLPHERAWMEDLVERYNGTEVWAHEGLRGEPVVRVFQVQPGPAPAAPGGTPSPGNPAP